MIAKEERKVKFLSKILILDRLDHKNVIKNLNQLV